MRSDITKERLSVTDIKVGNHYQSAKNPANVRHVLKLVYQDWLKCHQVHYRNARGFERSCTDQSFCVWANTKGY